MKTSFLTQNYHERIILHAGSQSSGWTDHGILHKVHTYLSTVSVFSSSNSCNVHWVLAFSCHRFRFWIPLSSFQIHVLNNWFMFVSPCHMRWNAILPVFAKPRAMQFSPILLGRLSWRESRMVRKQWN